MNNKEVILHDTPSPIPKPVVRDIIERDSAGKFLPGVSANPLGRSKDTPIITPVLKQKVKDNVESITDGLIDLAIKPGVNQLGALKEIYDRTDGKVKEQIEVESRNVNIVFELAEE